ncbi:succinate dehydrogenase/fumarate reductase flavoprotein subunit [Pseudochelatococcus lubricantis]|uniref:Succinate dehydrogenase/fumarate reductase flavoprotein subunit n=1 Tax=Pseudochelatococcus lubricantis TaxID=1538102 RepID=A0ABX0V6H1_9HYPH|nr:FAD-binding protein [Pseudochelatococcus lubricantis]NIJ59694.1 succinate dehydrogenase/fumarate reductase flavoprotein subunit [Pseudochelatococcus lubricantis]
MTISSTIANIAEPSASLELDADVLVIGGGPAGTWAAIAAAGKGARVVLVDKGFCGSSGATAPSGTGVWYVPPDPARRGKAMNSRWDLGGRLADPAWMRRTLDQTYRNVNHLAEWGYPFPNDGEGRPIRVSLNGPDYMRLMRKRTKAAGVKILDQSPATELLRDETGAVAGAAGVRRQKGDTWLVRAGAVVIATGGCAFLSRALGCNVLTGDGLLLAAELGAELSGMEFSSAYAMALEGGSVTKTRFYEWASFTFEDGSPVPGAASKGGRSAIARALATRRVFARLDKADAETEQAMRHSQPNFFLPLDRAGIDPFSERFPITLLLEGTVRGTGGLRIVDNGCATTVPGLYAAGDAATRELICGAFTGGGSHNAAWAMSSGFWAGSSAAGHGRDYRGRSRRYLRAGGAGVADGTGRAIDARALVSAVQAEVTPYERNYQRSGERLADSLGRLDALWSGIHTAQAASLDEAQRTREGVAMLATSRWMYRSALSRTESRGMHKREDFPEKDDAQLHHTIAGGLDEVWIGRERASAPEQEVLAA